MKVIMLQWTRTSLESQNWRTYLWLYLTTVATIYKINSMASLLYWTAKLWNSVVSVAYFNTHAYQESTGSDSHTCQQVCVRTQKKNAVQSAIWTWWNIHTLIYWFVTPCSLVGGHQHCGGNCCLPFQTRRDFLHWTQTAVSSDTLIKMYEATQCHNPEHASTTRIVE
jgi:hypothetical protein